MTVETCFGFVCFIPLDASGQKFFGFSEFLAALALMVLAWTIADVRYQFRVRTAPIPLQSVTFSVVAGVGVLTLLTDLWRAEQWLVPHGTLLTPASWQALLGALFLLTFLAWAWFAFIQPSTYSRFNAERYAKTLYHFVLKGSSNDLAVIADELTYSVKSIVHHACDSITLSRYRSQSDEKKRIPPKVARYANDLLLLIADKRLCRVIVESSPGTLMAIFQEMSFAEKYDIQLGIFARNIVNEAILNKNSFLFHEAEGYESGLMGYHKPLSQAMFSNYHMIEVVDTMLDPAFPSSSKWDASQWGAYSRIVLMAFRSFVEAGSVGHSFTLYRAMKNIENVGAEIYKLNGVPNISWDNDAMAQLRVVVDFINDAVNILEEKDVPDRRYLRVRGNQPYNESLYDHLASMIFEVVLAASSVATPVWECWLVQHNTVWTNIFGSTRLANHAGRIVQFKARRLLYEEILRMNKFANFQGARILGFCLNVMGLKERNDNQGKSSRALQKVVLAWTKKYYIELHNYNFRVGEACLMGGITYDPDHKRIVKTYLAEGLRREPQYVYLELDPVAPNSGTPP
ncbi:hypothetical protein [Janthinobacterium sp. UMAB-56]|uniref:hypothetical protein n=1 Tax=Janthinobacterium sp. UMAB-56 TaxID=1365361 RepID=UPI001C55C22B|nr:hypothetical protein [Janthinobacterium sp. UMAB-56]